MGNYDTDAASNMLHGYAQEGVWEKYNVPLLQRWIWTLGTVKTSILLGCFATFLTFSQSRSWVSIRYFVHLRKKAVRLEGDQRPDAIANLSQGRAITDMLPSVTHHLTRLWRLTRLIFRVRPGRPAISDESDSPVISLWFGIFAFLNLAFFGILTVALPYLLLEGALGAPVVKSKMTENCLNSSPYDEENCKLFREQGARTDAIFGVCLNRLNEGCGSKYYLQQPQIIKKRSDCPFPGDICHHGMKAFEITHSNITTFELGVNSLPRLALNHRLTCAPVHLDSFLKFDSKDVDAGKTVISVRDGKLQGKPNTSEGNYIEPLYTMNGPNSVSNESSGKRAFIVPIKEKGEFNLMVLPSYGYRNGQRVNPAFIHPDLRREDGESFLIIQRTGISTSRAKIDDPFFAAHGTMEFGNELSTPGIRYIPDYEATALGCFEQFQFCDPDSDICTGWEAFLDDSLKDVETQLERKENTSGLEYWMLFASKPAEFSMSEYLRARINGRNVPLTASIPWANPPVLNSQDQWITEIETWFMKGVLNSILFAQHGARVQLGNWTDYDSTALGNEHRLCDRILFRDSNYTNINWIGFWITTSLLTSLCIISYTIKWLDLKTRIAWKKLIIVVKTLRRMPGNFVGRRRMGAGSSEWLPTPWERTFFPHYWTSRTQPNAQGTDSGGNVSELRRMQRASDFILREIQQGDVEQGEENVNTF